MSAEASKETRDKSLARRRLSWVLKLRRIKEAHIPSTTLKDQNVRVFLIKMTIQKASQSVISTFPFYIREVKKKSLIKSNFGLKNFFGPKTF